MGNGPLSHHGFSDFAGGIVYAGLGENGKVDAAKLRPITYDPMNHHYLVLGEKVGQAFRDGLTFK